MNVLSSRPHTVAAAARRLGLARQSVQRVTKDLLADGLVVSAPDPSDARAPLMELTKTGQQLVAILYERSDADRIELIRQADLTAQRLRSLAARSERSSTSSRIGPTTHTNSLSRHFAPGLAQRPPAMKIGDSRSGIQSGDFGNAATPTLLDTKR